MLVCEDADGGLLGCVGGVFLVVDGDTGEQGAVEDALWLVRICFRGRQGRPGVQ